MKVLLAGGAGYIGSHTCVELIEAGHSVIIADNYSNSCPVAIERVEEITGTKIPHYEADVCDPEAVEKSFPKMKLTPSSILQVSRRWERAAKSLSCTIATTLIPPLRCWRR